jgi:hypothetical protein
MDELSIHWRRAKWFDYIVRRFDLVAFRDLADWIATEAGGVSRNEAHREQALIDLKDSIKRGEFGPAHERRCIPWLQKPPRSDMLGKLCLRLNYGQIVGQGASVTPDLYAARALCLKWLEARQLRLPPWLKHPEPPAGEPVAAPIEGAGAELSTEGRPKPHLEAVKDFFLDRVATWADEVPAASEDDDIKAVTGHFAPGISRDEIRTVRREVTPPEWRKQGPRRPWGEVRRQSANPPAA